MAEATYAVVSYLPGTLRDFVDALRRRFDPALAAWLGHVTILPPRALTSPVQQSVETIRRECALFQPFEVSISGVAAFWPISGVVYLSFEETGRTRLMQLHEALNCDSLTQHEVHSYIPHITIAQDLDESEVRSVMADVEREWSRYASNAAFQIESLFLVQKTPDNRWIDLAPIPLGDLLPRFSEAQ